jgi:hypothetical protein
LSINAFVTTLPPLFSWALKGLNLRLPPHRCRELLRSAAMSKRNRPTTAAQAAHRRKRHAYRSARNSPEGKAARAAAAQASAATAKPAPKPAAAPEKPAAAPPGKPPADE